MVSNKAYAEKLALVQEKIEDQEGRIEKDPSGPSLIYDLDYAAVVIVTWYQGHYEIATEQYDRTGGVSDEKEFGTTSDPAMAAAMVREVFRQTTEYHDFLESLLPED